MRKTIFSKYNRSRRKEYRIATSIFEENGKKFVEKRALSEEAKAHINALKDKTEAIKATLCNIEVTLPAIMDGKAIYTYIEGSSIEEELKKKVNEQETLLHELKLLNQNLFAFTESFVQTNEEGELLVKPANLDMLYDNLIRQKDRFYMIDCEWVFDEAMPVKYLEFRALYYFYSKHQNELNDKWNLYEFLECFAISREKADAYLKMEEAFQIFVHGENGAFDDRSGCEKELIFVDINKDNKEQRADRIKLLQNQEELAQLQEEHLQLQEEHLQLQEKLSEKEEENAELKVLYEQSKVMIEKQEEDMHRLSADIAYLNNLAHTKDAQIAERSAYAVELEQIIAKIRKNPFYRVGSLPGKVLRKALPKGSRRRKVLGYIRRNIKHPIRLIKKMNPEDMNRWYGDMMLGEGYRVHGRVAFPYEKAPKVSIVIPVYNQVTYTYNCLVSILQNTKDVSYEVILADDVSTDATRKIKSFTKNVVVSRNSSNMGFLKNCNQAAKKARGEYILFLNNDTTVGENWLLPLVELMEKDAKTGMVGSKLVYPDGRLQEAGGIIWQDGTGWNFGRMHDPSMPEYNYVKEADYISGAAIMVRTAIWKQVGGFDERFAPAYYEDTDLAFQVRQLGYKVLYQPLSVVTHYEGISNGTDLSSGLKKYQVDNAKKFLDKWKDVLESEHAKGPEQLFLARDRSQNKKIVLFIDHYVPHFDKDAGSKSTFAYVKAFLRQGYSVKFIGDNFFPHQPYTSVLQQMGVEVLYGDWYYLHWKEWLMEHGKDIAIAFMERPHITIKYIDLFRQYSDGKIIYYGHDLHYVREMREYQITKNPEVLVHAKAIKGTEYTCMEKSDVVYYPSYVEVDEIKKNNDQILARAIPVYVYEEPNTRPCKNIRDRKDIMFVGGFAHGPNVDAVKWFVTEIFPAISKVYPDMKFYVMGSNPPQEILDLASDQIIIKGFVSDEELDQFYQNCRMAVVPLRYGAGMKGKVIEAMYNKIPLITTPIGAEGLKEYDKVMRVYEEADAFAKCVLDLYEQYEELEEMIDHMPKFIQDYFSIEAAMDIISQDIK